MNKSVQAPSSRGDAQSDPQPCHVTSYTGSFCPVPASGKNMEGIMITATIVIDMQNDFTRETPAGALHHPNISAILPTVRREVAAACDRGLPLFYTVDAHADDDPEFIAQGGPFPPHATTAWGRAVHPDLLGESLNHGVLVHKSRLSAFHVTSLLAELREANVDTVRLVGCCTDLCVLLTAADAINYGFRVEVVTDAVATFSDRAQHDAALKIMETIGCAMVVPSAVPV